MSTEQEDAAMLLELEAKITHRIREQIMTALNGYESVGSDPEGTYTAKVMNDALINGIAFRVASSPALVTNITKAVIQKLSSTYIS
jgi:hypothetical protein